MPGLTTTAIVLMWVMVALSTIGAILAIPMVATTSGLFGTRLAAVTVIAAGQGLIWAGFRAFFAVRIARRDRSARTAAIVVECAALACQLVIAVLMFDAAMSTVSRFPNFNFSFDCTGIVLPVLVICFLLSARSRWWCDR
jgi:hypothetical protein